MLIVIFHTITATTTTTTTTTTTSTTMSTNNMIYLKKWKNILELLD